jgi:hypothetical protein
MADKEHLARLKQEVHAWNRWRDENPEILPDLAGANLFGVNLAEANLRKATLSGATLSGVTLTRADLSGADLTRANLLGADLTGADLTRATLTRAYLSGADLSGADLTRANLLGANLHGATLHGATFHEATSRGTIWGNVDLSTARGLETVQHQGPSTIGIDTLYRSQGNIPEAFLRGTGVPDDIITYRKSLVGRPFEFYSCFISYNHTDKLAVFEQPPEKVKQKLLH